ncbi:MAG: sel1 repeat family protein [Candidatus Paracaedibacteraceae bacterium]|nr:sel1 repeat family protein [Candidatus Paracaedibacteraceae bacterium]
MRYIGLTLTLIGLSSTVMSMEYTGSNYKVLSNQPLQQNRNQRDSMVLKSSTNGGALENTEGSLLYNQGLTHYDSAIKSPQQKDSHLQIARSLLTEAAEKGHLGATKLLGKMWENGEGGDKNYDEAEKFYLNAKNLGDIQVAYQLEMLYKKTGQGGKRFDLYKELAEAGKSSAQVALGNMYLEGVKERDIAPNMDEAIEWYARAAEQADLKGQYFLGCAYFKLKNYEEAAKYFKQISDHPQSEKILGNQSLGEVKNALGNIYARKRESARKALKLYEESLDLGNRKAQEMLDAVSEKLPKAKRDEYGEEYQPLL